MSGGHLSVEGLVDRVLWVFASHVCGQSIHPKDAGLGVYLANQSWPKQASVDWPRDCPIMVDIDG